MRSPVIVLWVLGWLVGFGPGGLLAGGPDLVEVMGNRDAVARRGELVVYVRGLGAAEVPGALERAIAGDGPGREEMIAALAGRWVELDGEAALVFSRGTTDRAARNALASAYYGAWAERDAAGVLKAAARVSAGERATAVYAVVEQIGARDPRRALELIQSVREANMQDRKYFLFWHWAGINLPEATEVLLREARADAALYSWQIAIWAITDRLLDDDPPAAGRWVAGLPAGKMRDQAFTRLVSEWGKADPAAATQWLKTLPDTEEVRNAMLNLSQRVGTKPPAEPVKPDPAFAGKAAEFDKILGTVLLWQRLEALEAFVNGLAPTEFPQALERLRSVPQSNRESALDLLVARWSKVDPAGAIRAIPLAETIHDSEFADQFLAGIYAAWARRDPEAAYTAATRDHKGVGNYATLRVLFAALARRDPVAAYAAFQKLDDANSHLLVVPIFTEWAVRDLPGATATLSQEKHAEGAIEGIVIGLLRQGPDAATAWADQLPDASRRDLARQFIARRWPQDPRSAVA